MYAIVEIAGQQFKVEKDQKLYVHRLEGDEGKKVLFDRVLLIDTGKNISVGDPVISGAQVSAKIISHIKGDKVLVFKKKRRKGYKKLNGHRQYLTQIQIEGISEKAAKPKAAAQEAKPAEKKAAETKPKAAETKPKATEAKPKAAGTKPKATETKPKAAAAKPKATTAKPKATTAKPKTAAADKKPAAKKPAAKPAAKKEDKS